MDNQFPKRLRYARSLRDMTMEEAAKGVGVSYQSWQQWESGDTTPRQNRLAKIARALNVSEQWLTYGGAELAPVSERVTVVSSTARAVGDVSHIPFAYRQLVRLLTDPTTQAAIPVEMVEKTYEHYQDVIAGRVAPDV